MNSNKPVEKIFVKCPFMTDAAYRRNLVLYDFLLMDPIPEGGFSVPYESDPQKFTFPFWLGYLSCLQNPELEEVPFSRWLSYVKRVIKLAAASCKYQLSDAEKILYPYAVAIRVYPNAEKYIADTKALSTDRIEKILSIEPQNDEQKQAMYIVANTVLYAIESEKEFRPHLFISLMNQVKTLDEEFPDIEKKFDNYRIGKGLYD